MVVPSGIAGTARSGTTALPDQRLDLMLAVARIAPVAEKCREPLRQSNAAIKLAQRERAGIRGDGCAVETSNHRPTFEPFKPELFRRTLCQDRGFLRDQISHWRK